MKRKAKIQGFSDQTSSTLKKHVYENYMQFIETAKEISHVESEMCQLSHILIEQRNLLSTLRDGCVVDDPRNALILEEDGTGDHQPQSLQDSSIDTNRNTIDLIKDTLIGFSGNHLDNKTFIHEGGLIELDSMDYRPICRTHLFLFNDLLIIAKVKHDKKLMFLNEYETKKLAVINIRDLDGVRNAINLMTPDGSRIFQCINPAAKSEWIEKFEVSVKFNQNKPKKGQAPLPPVKKEVEKPAPVSQQSSMDTSPLDSKPINKIIYAPDWLNYSPEEIQSLVAQRHFEDALNLIQKSEEYMAQDSTFHNAMEIGNKVKDLKNNLANVLLLELSNCQSRSLNATLRSTRRPLKLLAEMKKAREACGTMLNVCTTAIRTAQRQARSNNLDISELFFCDLAEVASDFLKAFHSQAACTSALVVWCNLELQYFASQLIKHYLTTGTELDTVAKVVENVRVPCAKLTEIGLDLSYYMEGLLRKRLEEIIRDSNKRLVQTISRTEDVWQPYNLQSKSKVRALLREMDHLGIDLKGYVTGDTWINLSQSTINFCRQFLGITENCATLAKNESLKLEVESLLRDVFLAQMAIKPNPAISVDVSI